MCMKVNMWLMQVYLWSWHILSVLHTQLLVLIDSDSYAKHYNFPYYEYIAGRAWWDSGTTGHESGIMTCYGYGTGRHEYHVGSYY